MLSSTPIFACSDIEASLAHYRDVLGFESSWTWGEPPTFGSASMGGVTIMFNLQPELAPRVRGHQHWIRVEDADALYRVHQSNGAKIVDEIEDKPWGVREYVVEDLNGYFLRFAGPASTEAPKSKPFPEGVILERRKPTISEFLEVAGSTFGYSASRPTTEEVLERTWSGVVARGPSGDSVGVLRIVWDALGWFSIWDVAVLPDWQAQRIGSKMMEEAIEMIRGASPGAIVYLFTYKHGFYERLGFTVETASLRRL